MNLFLTTICIAMAFSLVISAVFSAAEVAIFSLRGQALKTLRLEHPHTSDQVVEILGKPRKFLVTLLLGIVFSNTLFVYCVTLLFFELHPGWRSVDLWKPIVGSVGVLIFFAELLPKAVGGQRGSLIAIKLARFLRWAEAFCRPFVSLFDRISQLWVMRLIPSALKPVRGLSEQEYLTILDVGAREGAIRPLEKSLIERTLGLGNRNIRELMIPRAEMKCVNMDLSLAQMREVAAQCKHRRLPIYSENLDSIVGVLNVKCFLVVEETDMMAWIEPASFVPETMTALELFKNFVRTRQHMAMVVDEFGGVEGLITIEDIVEEIFGELYDEYDEDAPLWTETGSKAYKFQGAAPLSGVAEQLGIPLETEGVDTLGGWMMDRLGALPRVGDRCEAGGYTFLVEKMRRLRIGTILVWKEKKKGGAPTHHGREGIPA
jgi:putative hemolysin